MITFLILMTVFLALMALNMPIAFAIGISGALFFLLDQTLPFGIIVQRMLSSTQSYPLLAVPFFILAGNLLNSTGITKRLIHFSTLVVGHMAGGLAHVSCILSTLMGGISGSAVADAAMESKILGSPMISRGYSKGFSAAVIAFSSLITATIPPSIGLILYGVIAEVSIGQLFIGGIIPGILLMIFMMVVSSRIAKKRGYVNERKQRATIKEISKGSIDCIWAVLFPVILFVGIKFGIFTPSEGGAFACVYAIIVGKFIYKELNWINFKEAIYNSVRDTVLIMFIISTSGILGYAITYLNVAHKTSQLITGITTNPQIMLIVITGILLIAGMFLESNVIILLLTPILVPIIRSIGINPVHFGLIMILSISLGLMTPPVGIGMYTVCSLLDCKMDEYTREAKPFIAVVLLVIIILILLPEKVVLYLPNLVF